MISAEEAKVVLDRLNSPWLSAPSEMELDADIALVDQFVTLLDERFEERYSEFINRYGSVVAKHVTRNEPMSVFFKSTAAPLVYFLAKVRSYTLPHVWPYESEDRDVLERIYYDIGVVPPWDRP